MNLHDHQQAGSHAHAIKAPWQLTRGAFVRYAEIQPIPRVTIPGPASWSEADLAAHKRASVRLETEPPEVPKFPVGSWCLMPLSTGGDWLWHLEEIALRDLSFNQGDPFDRSTWGWGDINHSAVEKYTAWIKAGHEPPPLEVWQMQSGRKQVKDGHNRAAALVTCERSTALVWVSPLIETPNGWETLSHRLAVEAALRAGKPVPAAVLAEYPDLAI